ncbi:MAG: flagellar hook-length control protein FliK [Gammaproteobacteria bacterium]|nr:flagellar hook-length control protein FliK [Gammaproteobacteria bacterium]
MLPETPAIPGNPADPFIFGDLQADITGDAFGAPVPDTAPPGPLTPEEFLPPGGKALPSEPAESPVSAEPTELFTANAQDDDGNGILQSAGNVSPALPDPTVETTGNEQSRADEPESAVAAAPVDHVPVVVHAAAVVQVTGEVVADTKTEPVRIPAPVSGAMASPPNGGVVATTPAPVFSPSSAPVSPSPAPVSTSVSAPMAPEAVAEPVSTPDGGARLQELLARLGSNDGASSTRGDAFQSLLRDSDGGSPANTGPLTYFQAGASAQSREVPVPGPALHTPLRHPEWSDELGQRIRWAIGNQIQTAELKINPPQLGPLEIRISVDADRQMSVTLSSQHALVREALHDSIPRLRDLMGEQGFGAVNVDVSQHSPSDGGRSQAHQGRPESLSQVDSVPADAAVPGEDRPSELRGLVDLYA